MERFSYISKLRCVSCSQQYSLAEGVFTCPSCGELLGTLDVIYDIGALKLHLKPADIFARKGLSIWRYHELLPLEDGEFTVDFPVGKTPLIRCEFVHRGKELQFFIKDDSRMPSGSLKDRASIVGVSKAMEGGYNTVACASTGNAASSLAAMSARAGLRCIVIVPHDAPVEKLTQLLVYGAEVFAIEGSYDEAFELCMQLCRVKKIYNRNTAVNPYLLEGKKTVALEIWEDFGGRCPDYVFVPVGDGCIISGVYKGFSDLQQLGWIERIPKIVGVQAEGSSAIARAWNEGLDRCLPSSGKTVADSISVSIPRDQIKALRAVRRSDGAFIVVTDEEILVAQRSLAMKTGVFAEPAASASFAGYVKAVEQDLVDQGKLVCLIVTGSGLKDVKSARIKLDRKPVVLKPDIGCIINNINRH